MGNILKYLGKLKQRILMSISSGRRDSGLIKSNLPKNKISQKKFLYNGSPVKTLVNLLKGSKNFKVNNPEKFVTSMIGQGALGRIHSCNKNIFTVWLLDEVTYQTIIIEVPQYLMGQYFEQYDHDMLPYLR